MTSPRVDARALAPLRVAVGVASVVKAARTYPVLSDLVAGEVLRLPLTGVPLPPAGAVPVLLGGWALCGVLLAVGWRPRLWAFGCVVAVSYVLALDQQLYSNHLYLLVCFAALLALSNAAAAGPRAAPAEKVVPAWQLFLLRTQVTVVYLFAGLSKLNAAFLSGALIYAELPAFREQVPLPLFTSLAAGAVMVELFVAVGLWLRTTRRAAVVAGVALHIAIVVVMSPTVDLLVFAALLISAYPLFGGWTFPLSHAAATRPGATARLRTMEA